MRVKPLIELKDEELLCVSLPKNCASGRPFAFSHHVFQMVPFKGPSLTSEVHSHGHPLRVTTTIASSQGKNNEIAVCGQRHVFSSQLDNKGNFYFGTAIEKEEDSRGLNFLKVPACHVYSWQHNRVPACILPYSYCR